MITDQQLPTLMYVYHSGYAAIYILFFLMYLHAKKKANEIDLSPAELFETDSFLIINALNAGLGIAGVLLVFFLRADYKGSTGLIYMVIPFMYSILFIVRGENPIGYLEKLLSNLLSHPASYACINWRNNRYKNNHYTYQSEVGFKERHIP